MLIKINNTIINVANIVSAHFTPATENLKGALTIVFVNNVERNVFGNRVDDRGGRNFAGYFFAGP